MKTNKFIQASAKDRIDMNLRPPGECVLGWHIKFVPGRETTFADDAAGNKYTVTNESTGKEFPYLLLIATPIKAVRLFIRCRDLAEASSYAEDYSWNQMIGYVENGRITGVITACFNRAAVSNLN